MDDSIQTLKDEMNKLMSVYEHVKLKPEDAKDKVEAVEVNLSVPSRTSEKSLTPIITEMGQSVLEVVGDEAVIRFKAKWGRDFTEHFGRVKNHNRSRGDFVATIAVNNTLIYRSQYSNLHSSRWAA